MSVCSTARLPVGLRFQPTEKELLTHFLRLKMIGKDSDVDHFIAEVDFCLWDPWELPAKSKIESDDQIWWFFCRRESSKRPKRTTKSGHWKITGKGREIMDGDNKVCIGKKKILVFHMGPTPGRKTNWVMHEYYPQPEHALPNPRSYVICRLEQKAAKKDGSPAFDEGEPSGSGNIADTENLMTPAANSEVHDCAEENADLLAPPLFSPGDFLSEDIRSISSDCLKNDHQVNLDTHENHPEPENSPPQVHGCIEENAYSLPQPPLENAYSLPQPPFSPDDVLTEEDIKSIFSDCLKDDQLVNSDTHENYPELENSPPQGPYVISSLENKTEEKAGTPGCVTGEQSEVIISGIGNQGPPVAILEVHGQARVNDDQNKMQASYGADKPEDIPTEFWDGLYENFPGEKTNNLFSDDLQPTSLKRLHPPDVPASVDAGIVGVDQRFKRSRSLAPGELLP